MIKSPTEVKQAIVPAVLPIPFSKKTEVKQPIVPSIPISKTEEFKGERWAFEYAPKKWHYLNDKNNKIINENRATMITGQKVINLDESPVFPNVNITMYVDKGLLYIMVGYFPLNLTIQLLPVGKR